MKRISDSDIYGDVFKVDKCLRWVIIMSLIGFVVDDQMTNLLMTL